MVSYKNYKCWEIMSCDKTDCQARREPETPCWEIAKRIGAYQYVSNTCKDCVIYLLKTDASVLSINNLENLIEQKEFWENIETLNHDCILKSNSIN